MEIIYNFIVENVFNVFYCDVQGVDGFGFGQSWLQFVNLFVGSLFLVNQCKLSIPLVLLYIFNIYWKLFFSLSLIYLVLYG